MITSEPNSPTALAKASVTPERTPGRMFGRITRRKVATSEAPSDLDASSISRSSSCSTGWTVRTTTSGRKVVTRARDRADPSLSLCTRTRRGATATAASTSDATDLPLDLGHEALARVEEVLLPLRPTAEAELVDRELAGTNREL